MIPLYGPMLNLLHRLPPERAHDLAIWSLKRGIVPSQNTLRQPITLGKLTFCNPLGLAAGFDKNGEAVSALLRQGFGFVECGTVTPRPQSGNPKPRLFRLSEDQGIINRMGFNNGGLEVLKRNLDRQARSIEIARRADCLLGINIGKNKDSEDAVSDYLTMLAGVAPYADYVTVNISSPNTPGLRDLQEKEALSKLLDAVCNKREQLEKPVPLWLKLAPDLDDEACEVTAKTVLEFPIDGLVISNTTISRPEDLKSPEAKEQGGLSGSPLMPLATDRLRMFAEHIDGKIPLVGVGGISTAQDVRSKLEAGATLVQMYSALIYQGMSAVPRVSLGFA